MPGLGFAPDGARARYFAPTADRVEVCLFRHGDEERIALTPDGRGHHEGSVPDAGPGDTYGLRIQGPWRPDEGVWHDPALLLVDPFARAIRGEFVDHPSVHHDGPRRDSAPWVPRSVLVEDPAPPRPGPDVPWEETVIYETHVRSLTMLHPDVPPELRGTYLGAASPPVIDHLLRLGVTTVELMPVAHYVTEPFLQARGMRNYWGYSTLGWFAPHAGYATGDDGRQVAEFCQMVDRFHGAGLEVIVDVVFNHTAEGGRQGPILSCKGLDNRGWYRIDHRGGYVDWTGTGNTVDTRHAHVRRSIVAALRWWAAGLGVDGFRFDLGVALGRDGEAFDPAHLAWLTDDPVLSTRKLVAEPWDLGPNGYRLGHFAGEWREWNGRFRDDVRDFWRGKGDTRHFALRLGGSPDIFGARAPGGSVNFVTSHDGFTLADLVAYDRKHNEANGEGNRDGHDDNRSWNSGHEGPTDDRQVVSIRSRRSSALVATTLLSPGIPMLLGGDELGVSHHGNNNAYPLDELNWYVWDDRPHADLIRRLTGLRRVHPALRHGQARVLDDTTSAVVELSDGDDLLVVLANPGSVPDTCRVPDGRWVVAFDSSGTLPPGTVGKVVEIPGWSVVVLSPAPTKPPG